MGAVGGVAILGGNFEAPQFPEDKFIQRSLTVGDQESSPIDAVILDAPALGAPGQRDSHATIWKGHSNDGSPHTIDWKLFVDVTADDGTGSLWTLQTRIDAAAYATVMTIDDNGLLTVSGATFTMDQLIIDSDNTEAVLIRKDGDAGDVFIVDTINDVVRLGSDATTLTFGASSDAIFKYIGPGTVAFDDDITEPFFQVVSGSDNTIGGLRWLINDRFQVGTFAGSPRNVQITRGDVPIIEVTNAQVGFGTPGTPGDAIPLVFLFGNAPEDIIIMDTIALTTDGQRDSHSILWTGKGFESATPHDIDWKQFVDVTADDGTGSLFTWQTRIDAASYGTRMTLKDDADFTLTGSDGTLFYVSSGNVQTGIAAIHLAGNATSPSTTNYQIKNVGTNQLRLNAGGTPPSQSIRFSISDVVWGSATNIGQNFWLFNKKVEVRLAEDQIGLLVTGHSTQTSNLVEFVQDDTTTKLFTFTNEAVMTLGEDIALQVAASDDKFIITGPALTVDSTAAQSHRFLIQGRTRTAGSVDHTSDWRMVVQPFSTTGFDGQSQVSFVGGIDGGSFITPLKLVNNGRVAINQPEQFSIGSPTFRDNIHVNITGAFVDDYGGGPDSTYKVLIDGSSTGDSTRTNRQALFAIFDGNIITQNNSETINNVGAMFVNVPIITPGTDTINEAFTAKFLNAPTAGTENYTVIMDQTSPGPPDAILRIGKSQSLGMKLLVAGLGTVNLDQTAQTRLTGLFQPVASVADFASLLHIDARLQGTSGDTNHLTGAHFAANVRTQGVTENIANISQVQIDEPDITDVLLGDITNAQSLLITGAPTEGESNYAQRILGGDFQIANASAFLFRNAGDAADLTALSMGASNFLEIGGPGSADFEQVSIYSLGSIVLFPTDDAKVQTDNDPAFTVRSANGSVRFLQVESTQTKVIGSLVVAASVVNNQAETEIQSTFADVATSSGSSVFSAGLIPAGSFLIGVTVRVLTTVTGPTGFDVGDGTDVDRWGNSIAVAAGTTTDITDFSSSAVTTFPFANDVRLTSDGVDFTGGSVRITVHYITLQTSAA